jgi:hypothetical protein
MPELSPAAACMALVAIAAAAHTTFTAHQLPWTEITSYGLERYTAFIWGGPCFWLLVHTAALWLLLRSSPCMLKADNLRQHNDSQRLPFLKCRVVRDKAAAVGPVVQLQAAHLATAMLSLEFVLFMHGTATAWPLGFAIVGRALLHRLPQGRAGLFMLWAYAGLAVTLNNLLEVRR